LEALQRSRVAGMFNPPLVGDPNGLLGAINVGNAGGGTNWPGGGLDPETHIAYAVASASSVAGLSVRKPPAGFSDINYVSGREGTEFRVAEGPGFGSAADAPQRGGAVGQAAAASAAEGGGRGGRGGRGAATPAGGAAAPPPGRARGAMLRAYDKATGKEVGAVWMPAQQSGSPMAYKGADGRQYIVVAVSGGNYSGEYVAFALPGAATPTTAGQ